MIEKIVLDWLTANLAGIPVYMEKPTEPPDSYVLVEKTGSGMENRIYSAMIAVQSYAPSKYEAAELNDEVKTAMDAIVALTSVSACSLNSDYDYTDTDTHRYRYQAVFDIIHY